MHAPPREAWLLIGLLLLVVLPTGGVAIARGHLLSQSGQAEPPPPDVHALPQQPAQPHDPPDALTPAARVDAAARHAASGGHDPSKPLPDGYTATPAAGRLVTASPTPSAVAITPVASFFAPGPLLPSPTPTPPPLPTDTAGPTPAPTASATPSPTASATPRPSPSPSPTPTH